MSSLDDTQAGSDPILYTEPQPVVYSEPQTVVYAEPQKVIYAEPRPVYVEEVIVRRPFSVSEAKTIREEFAPAVCEFLGTFLMALAVGYCSIFADPSWGPLAVGSALMVLTYSMGPVSGANFNPAVSLTLGFLGKLKWPAVFLYIIVQLCAGLLAGLAISSLFHEHVKVHPTNSYGLVAAAFGEIFYTFVLCFVFASCAAAKRNNPKTDGNQFYALAIGQVLVAGGHAVGPFSGALFNPAVAVGFAVSQHATGFLYVGLHVVGAAMAAMIFKAIRPEDSQIDDEAVLFGTFVPSIESCALGEFIGTAVLVITVGLNILTHSKATSWAAGAALMSMIYSLADLSGGHLNPAVTLAIYLSGRIKCSALHAVVYMLMQVIAAIISGFLLSFIHDQGPFHNEIYGVAPQAGFSWSQVLVVEMIFTFLLCWVVLSVATASLPHPGNTSPPKKNFYFALAIASCVIVVGPAIGSVSGGCINPAVAVGLQVEMSAEIHSTNTTLEIIDVANTTSGDFPITVERFTPDLINFLWFALAELGGGALAAITFHATHAHEFYAKNAAHPQ